MIKGRKSSLFILFMILSLVLGMNTFVYGEELSPEQQVSESQKEQPKLTIEEVTFGMEYDVKLTEIQQSDYDYIVFKVWKELNGEQDAKLYPAEWIAGEEKREENENPYYFTHLLINDQDQPDTYQIVAYGVNTPEANTIESPKDITIDMINDEEISFEIDKTSFTTIPTDDEDEDNEEDDEDKDKDEDEEKVDGDEATETDSKENIEKEESPIIVPKVAIKSASSSSGIRGIDVSHHNGVIDWTKVKSAGIKYAIIRCGYGDNITSQDDRQWTKNVSECERLGIPYGVYIYSHASTLAHAKSEADHCLRLLMGHHPSYPVFLDLEDKDVNGVSNTNLASYTNAWAEKIEKAGYMAGVYSSKSWWTSKLTNPVYNNYCKWVAQWNTSCTYAGIYHAWQYSSEGHVNGISGNVDMNYWYGYSKQIDNYGETSGNGPVFGLYEIVSTVDENYAIDVYGALQANKTNVQLYARNGTGAQMFWIIPIGYDNQYYIMNRTSGKYLDVDGNATADCTNVWQYTGNGTSAQRFRIISYDNGEYEIQGVGSNKYVDLDAALAENGRNIQIYKSNHTAAQKWKLVPTKDLMPTSYSYEIVSSINPNYVVDILGGNKADKINAQLYKRNKTNAQKFTFVPLGHDDLYYIVNKSSGKVLDVEGNHTEDSTNVWQYTKNGTTAQIFKLIPLDDGRFEILGLGSGKYLDAYAALAENGTNIQIYTGNGTKAQRWYLMRLD